MGPVPMWKSRSSTVSEELVLRVNTFAAGSITRSPIWVVNGRDIVSPGAVPVWLATMST